MELFRVALSADFQKPDGSPAFPSFDLSLSVTPAMADQELITNVRYWEGAA